MITCPICHGAGECEREARRYRRDMNSWIEYGCRACHATGQTTPEQVENYHANRRREALEAWQREQRRREREERERELASMEVEAAA